MMHTETRNHVTLKLETHNFELPGDELDRIHERMDELAQATDDLTAELDLKIIYHDSSEQYHVDASLHLPQRGLHTGDWDPYLDLAIQRCLRKLVKKTEAYMRDHDRDRDKAAARTEDLSRNIIAPDLDAGPLAAAVDEQDYLAFRKQLANFDDWLRLRIGRWIQRYPELNAEVGTRFEIPDIIEEVYLNAFEHYNERPSNTTLSQWLEDLIDPSIKMLARHPARERENIEIVRSLRELP